jgi:excisionase family DNA binding protein
MPTDWMTIPEGAKLFGYHPEHLRELIRDGKIAAVKKGNAWWVDRRSLTRYVKTAQKTDDKRHGPKGSK